jgi:hypothetical protein
MVTKAGISVNKLAEFIVKRSARQRQIVYDRKYPDPDFNMGNYHREVREAVSRYLADGAIDPSIIRSALKSLRQQPTDKIGTGRRINANIDALESFSEMLDEIDLDDFEVTLGEHAAKKLVFHNVEVSVRPEMILRKKVKGKNLVGAIKLHFSKTFPHTEESAGYVAAVLQEYLDVHLVEDGEIVHPPSCFVIDTASKRVYRGVKATTKRMQDVEAACQHIRALWESL